MDLREFLNKTKEKCFRFLKWIQIIQQEDKATALDSMYILEKNKDLCELIFVDSNGNKRKLKGVTVLNMNTPELIDATILNELYGYIKTGDYIIDVEKSIKYTKLGDLWFSENIDIIN